MSDLNLIDTHAHLDFEQFEDDVDGAVERAKKVGVNRIINVGTTLERSRQSVLLTDRFENVYAAVGVHPSDANDVNDEVIAELKDLAAGRRVVAVGEIGFDFYHDDNPDETAQVDAFFAQSEVAVEAGLPIIVHSRDAEDVTLRHLEEHAQYAKADNPVRQEFGVVHCFTGSLGFAEEALALGYLISFTAPVTYPKNDELRKVVQKLPIEKLMVETDCPFLPPADLRGKRNEPAFVVATAQAIADIKGIPLSETAQATTANAERLFGL